MNGAMAVVTRSMLSKRTEREEAGKLFTLLAVISAALPSGLVPLYASVYAATVESFSGAFNLLSAALTVPAQIILL
jgi:hypothetical protein